MVFSLTPRKNQNYNWDDWNYINDVGNIGANLSGYYKYGVTPYSLLFENYSYARADRWQLALTQYGLVTFFEYSNLHGVFI